MQRVSFTSRFLKLTFLGYLFSIVSVAAAVWFASAPALHKMELTAKRAHLETKANVIASILDNLVDEGRFIAKSPHVVAYLMKFESRPAEAIGAMLLLQGAVNMRLIDFSGNVVLSVGEGDVSSPFLAVEALAGLSDLVEGRAEVSPRISYRPGRKPYEAHFLITLPIVSLGVVEGLIAFEQTLDLSHVLSAGEQGPQAIIATPFQNERWSEWYDMSGTAVSTKMPGAGFYLIVDTDQKVIQTVGRNLVLTAIGVSLLALILPFSAMAASGMRAIVRPHEALEVSRKTLAVKQAELKELAQIAEMANESIFVTDANQCVLWVNSAFTKMTGYAEDEAVGRRPWELLQRSDADPEISRLFEEAIDTGRAVQAEILNYRKNGETYWVNFGISPLNSFSEGGRRFAVISTDITQAKEAQAKLAEAKAAIEKQSLHDALTGLPNRRYLDQLLEADVRDDQPPRTLIRVDLDLFKNINDTLGHAAGDYVLRHVGSILNAGIRAGDIATRVGGDEFVVLLGDGVGSELAFAMADRLLDQIGKEMIFEGKTCRVGASFGIASAMDGLISNSDLLKSADSALYTAKELGRNTATLYTPQLHSIVNEKRILSAEIEVGIKNGEFEAFFQPQFDAHSEDLVGIEALVRWRHPTRGLLPPSQFLPIADRLRLTSGIDQCVFQFGLEKVSQLNAEGLFIPKIAFNMDVNQIENVGIEDVVQGHDIGKTRVAIEVLESVLVEEMDHNFIDRIEFLKDRGFQIEVDDFGSGHASVIGLKHLQPHVMKLDRMLVQPVDSDATSRALVRSMIEIGKALNILVTAEGVETAEHASIMKYLGCDTLQGFYFAKPMSFENFRTFARKIYNSKDGKVASFSVYRGAHRD